jgi:hypothetical protein
MIVFMTYLLLMLKKLHPSDLSFVVVTQLVKGLARDINDENSQFSHQYQQDFNKFFMAHLLRNYCSIIIDSAVKRQPICELIYSHCQHDLQMRIKVVQSLKKHLKQDEVVYACHAFLIGNEESFNEQWFDVFLYYALIGLSNPKVNIRVYSLNVLNTIARHNAESILDITEKIFNVSSDKHWEIKTQCLEFAIQVLSSYKEQSHLVDDNKGGSKVAAQRQPNSPTAANGPAAGDRNSVKGNLSCAVDIIQNVFNVNAPKAVQKVGLFRLQPLLNSYRRLYPIYVDTLIQTDEEIKGIILSAKPDAENDEIYYSFGNGSFSYKLKSDINHFDRLLMANALIDMIIGQNFDSLLKEHMEIFMLCAGRDPTNTINVSQHTEQWFKFFQKFKDFLLIAICDEELVDNALVIMHNFLTSPNLKF